MVDHELLRRKAASVHKLLTDISTRGDVTLGVFSTNMDVQYYILFCLEKAAQDCLDLAGHVISDQGWEVADQYKDLFPVLERKRVIDADLSAFMQELAGFRNVLVHRYGALSYERAFQFYRERERLKEFCAAVLHHFEVVA